MYRIYLTEDFSTVLMATKDTLEEAEELVKELEKEMSKDKQRGAVTVYDIYIEQSCRKEFIW